MKYLVKRAQKQDKEAFVELMELNKQSMYKVARSYLSSEEDIADAMQETVLSCYKGIEKLKEVNYFKTWMIRILINHCNNIIRENCKECTLESFPEVADTYSYEQNIEFEELMNALDEKYRTILTLYYVDGFTAKEIGEILEMSENTVKTRLVRGRRQFAGEYGIKMVSGNGGKIAHEKGIY